MTGHYLIGGGGHARSVIEAAPRGFFSGYFAPEPASGFPVPYCGNDYDALAGAAGGDFILAVGYVGDAGPERSLRAEVIRRFEAVGFCRVVASDAFAASDAVIGAGTVLLHKAVVNAHSAVGRHCILNTASIVEHDCVLGTNVQLATGAIAAGGVIIGDNVFLGAGTIVRERVSICSGVVVGMGSLVMGDIVEPGTYYGSPARKIKDFPA